MSPGPFMSIYAGTLALTAIPSPVPVAPIAQCAATLAERDAFAGSVAIARGGDILFSRAYGTAGPGRGATVPETPHNIGSMSKMFTAVAIGQLVDAGRLSFDDMVGGHLPELPPDIGRVTIAQLLSHSSGLGDYFRIENREVIASARTAHDLLGIAVAGGLQFEPGTRRAYSNSGFVLLGALVERLSGQSFSDYVRSHIFEPAGMAHTAMDRPADTATPMTRLALRPDAPPREGWRPAPSLGGGRSSPAGGAYSTAADLVRFASALLANRLTRPETTTSLLRGAGSAGPADARRGDNGGYGYGFNLWEVNRVRFAGHGGGTPGVNGELAFNPSDGTAVAALSHYDPPSASQVVAFARRALADLGAVDQTLCGTLAALLPGMQPRPVQPEGQSTAGGPQAE